VKAEIIAIGSELLTPDHIDTNSLKLTQVLNEAGVEVHLKSIVGDDESDMAALLRLALMRSDLIVFSGGLGPTEDDLTRQVVASALGRELRVDPELLESLRRRFASRGYRMAKNNERQAQVIEGAEILPNPIGTAPGMWLTAESTILVLLPGPPLELFPMFEKHALPRIRAMAGGRRLVTKSFLLTGLTESEADSRAAPLYRSYPGIRTTILANPGHIALRMRCWVGPGEEALDLDELAGRVRREFSTSIFTEEGKTLEEVVGQLLLERGLTVAVAESCTAGLLGMRLTRLPGSSGYFEGGVLCYSNEQKRRFCGVGPDTLQAHGAVSAETAEALARGVRERFGTSLGISITGIAGPAGGSREKPVGLVYVGLADTLRTLHFRRILPGDRDMIRERAAVFALSSLRSFVLESGGNPGESR